MKAITLLSQTLTGLPLDEWCLFFYSFAKVRSVALEAPVGLFFSDVMVRRKYLFVEPLDIFAFIISNKIIQLSCGCIFLPSLPTRLSIIDLWGVDCLFTPNCPIGKAKRLTSQNSGCQQFWLLRSSLVYVHRLFTCRNFKVQGENATIKNKRSYC